MRRLALVVLVACSHSSPPPQQAATPSACDQVADHLVSLMSASQTADPEQVDPWRKKLAQHCTQDLWSAKAQDCVLATKKLGDLDGCGSLFTPSQNDALMGELAPKPAAAESAGAPPPPPAGDEHKTRGPKKAGDPCEGGE